MLRCDVQFSMLFQYKESAELAETVWKVYMKLARP